jgi:hypothetical protein
MAANYTAKATFVAHDRVSRTMRKMERSAQTFAQKSSTAFARVERRMRRLQKRVGMLGAVIGGALLIRAVSSTIGIFADFEQANASLASVMSTATRPELAALQKDAKRLGSVTAKSATEVVSLQEAFGRLGFGAKDIINMTEATINGSIGMQGELADTAELVGAMVKSFDDFGSADAPKIIDQLTRSTQASALNFEKLQTSLPIVAGAANAAKVPFTKLLASLGKLSDAGIDASSSSTALRNIFLEAAKRGVPYQKLLEKVRNSTDQLATANELFGKRGAVAAVILAKNTEKVAELDKTLQAAAGTAGKAAATNLDTLKGRVTLLKSAWEGFVLSVEDGNGKLGSFLKTAIEVVTEILNIASGSAKAEDALSKKEQMVRKIAKRIIKLGKVLGALVAGFVALKVAILGAKAVMAAAKFVQLIAVFMRIARMTSLWTAAQWALNIALNANPIGLVVLAIAALVAIIVIIIKKWKTIKEWLVKIKDVILDIIPSIAVFRDKWEMLGKVFRKGGIKAAIVAIGKTLFESLLIPIQRLLELISKIPGVEIAATGAEEIEALRKRLFAKERELIGEQSDLQTPGATQAQEQIKREERITNSKSSLEIFNSTGFGASLSTAGGAPIKLTNTN